MGRVGLALGIWCAAAVANAAYGDDFFSELKSAPGFTVTLGVDGRVLPRFEGSDRFEFIPVPLFDIRPMGTPARFTAPRDGLGVTIYEAGRFNAGPVLHLEFARKVRSDPALLGLGDVKWAVEVGSFAEFWPVDWLRARVELRKGFKGHHGVILDQAVDAIAPLNNLWTVSGGPRMRISDASGNGQYFDITPEQSLASGLRVYDTRRHPTHRAREQSCVPPPRGLPRTSRRL